MKKIIVISIIFAAFALALPLILSAARPLDRSQAAAGVSAPANSGRADVTPQETTASTTAAAPIYEDEKVNVRVLISGKVENMTMGSYLVGVVAGEMPATFEPEALKAQAVAARTFTLYRMKAAPSSNHPDADVCSDPTCCQAYKDDASMHEKWGDVYASNLEKIQNAVRETDGKYIAYNNEPILAAFHSSSAGMTEDCADVWGSNVPYLVSVKSPETADEVPNYVSTVTVSHGDFKETVTKVYPKAVFSADRNKWISDITKTESGRIKSLSVGGISMTGPELRKLFGLRSTAAKVDITDSAVTFTTTGYGHGVGMSQYGANALAQEGKNSDDILKWYYTGVTITNEAGLF